MNLEVICMEELIKKLDKKLKVTSYEYMDDILFINIERTNKSDICPCCGKKSTNIHSKYIRTIKDLPIQEYKVILNITAKIFFCKNKSCSVNTFAEQFDFIESHSRMTTRLKNKIVDDAKGMSARASKETINKSVAKISDDTILRLLKKNNIENKKRRN